MGIEHCYERADWEGFIDRRKLPKSTQKIVDANKPSLTVAETKGIEGVQMHSGVPKLVSG